MLRRRALPFLSSSPSSILLRQSRWSANSFPSIMIVSPSSSSLRFSSSSTTTPPIETLTVEEELSTSTNDSNSSSSESSSSTFKMMNLHQLREPDFAIMQTVARADAFAKPRLVNYCNRYGLPAPTYTITSSPDGNWYRCESQIPIFLATNSNKEPSRIATSLAFGKSEKDAENACAMHAERIIDHSGVELFSLSAMQGRHAEAVMKEGRWARFPKNHPKRKQQDAEMAHRDSSRDPPPLVCAQNAGTPFMEELKSAAQHNQSATNIGNSTSTSPKTTIVDNPHTAAEDKETRKTILNKSSSAAMLYYSKSLFSNDKSGSQFLSNTNNYSSSASDYIEISLDETKGTDDSELQHEGIEIDQADHADWRVFPRVSQNRTVPSAFKHMDESEGGKYWLVEFGMYYECEPHSILSPHLFCAQSLDRVRRFFEYHGKNFDDSVQLSKISFSPWAGQRTTLIQLSVEIPPGLSSSSSSEVAIGISKDQERGLHLCAMHCELLIDHLGLILFPDDEKLQEQHADFCASMGRWAPSEEGEVIPMNKRNLIQSNKPKPLREWGESVAVHAARHTEEHYARAGKKVGRGMLQARRIAPLSEEEFYMHCHHCLVAPNRGHTIEGNPAADLAEIDYIEVLRKYNQSQNMQRESFYLNLDYSGVYRCTTLLPLDIKEYGLRCGYAVGTTPQDAKMLAARHAVEVLTHFGIPVFEDKMRQKLFEEKRRREGRFVVERDPETHEPVNRPNPKSRSPPALRLAGPPRPLITHEDWKTAQCVDASLFNVVDTFGDSINGPLLIAAFENYCRNVFDPEHEASLWDVNSRRNRGITSNNNNGSMSIPFPSPVTCKTAAGVPFISYYWGLQPVKGRFGVQSNTAFTAVPLPRGHPARDALGGAGSVLAVGRSNDQKTAAKCLYVHALRIMDSLNLLEEFCLKLNSDFPFSSSSSSFSSTSSSASQPEPQVLEVQTETLSSSSSLETEEVKKEEKKPVQQPATPPPPPKPRRLQPVSTEKKATTNNIHHRTIAIKQPPQSSPTTSSTTSSLSTFDPRKMKPVVVKRAADARSPALLQKQKKEQQEQQEREKQQQRDKEEQEKKKKVEDEKRRQLEAKEKVKNEKINKIEKGTDTNSLLSSSSSSPQKSTKKLQQQSNIIDIEELRHAIYSASLEMIHDHRDESKLFSWGQPKNAKCAPIRLFDENGRPMDSQMLLQQKSTNNLIVQQLPVPVMSAFNASLCHERSASRRFKILDDQEKVKGEKKPVNIKF